jgi:lysophospholipase L1-like esterase
MDDEQREAGRGGQAGRRARLTSGLAAMGLALAALAAGAATAFGGPPPDSPPSSPPTSAPPSPPSPPTPPTPRTYVALGDSYAAGTGTSAPADACERTANAYPALFAAAQKVPSFTSVACGGARVADVSGKQVPSLSHEADLVTLTVGGNDVGFGAIGAGCVRGTPAQCRATVGRGEALIRDELPARLNGLLGRIRAVAPYARVVVLGYPRLFDAARCAQLGAPFDAGNLAQVNRVIDRLAEVTAASAARAGAQFVDMRAAFAGHEACAQDSWINLLTPKGALHPNDKGHQAHLAELGRALTGPPPGP